MNAPDGWFARFERDLADAEWDGDPDAHDRIAEGVSARFVEEAIDRADMLRDDLI